MAHNRNYGSNRHALLEAARTMRRNQTKAEARLWTELRDRRLAGYKFRRQHTIDGFIVDFCCLQHGLILEVDGGIHQQTKDYDRTRTARLNDLGYTVLRFSNHDVLEHIEAVKQQILTQLKELPEV